MAIHIVIVIGSGEMVTVVVVHVVVIICSGGNMVTWQWWCLYIYSMVKSH